MIRYDKRNYRKHNERNKELIKKSLTECGAGRSILLDADNSLIAGNGVYEQASKLGIPVRIIETDGSELIAVKRTDIGEYSEKRKRLALADNATSDTSEWNVETLKADMSPLEMEQWDVVLSEPEPINITNEDDIIERKRKEFEEKMAAGELDEDDPDYQEFLAKFEAKKTTDDCYTPAVVYEAVADFVAQYYKLSKVDFVRPFYPGGDYQREKYKPTDIVVDNPPFSILAEIIQWYNSHSIKYFLFAPHLTLFSSTAHKCTSLPVDASVTYENGANVSTSFCTNLEPSDILFRSEPTLYNMVKKANDANLRQMHKKLPKYAYPPCIVTTSIVSRYSRYGIDFVVREGEAEICKALDEQKNAGKTMFGAGYILGNFKKAEREKAERERAERERAEREKAEREKAEREKATVWTLSQRELDIIARLK